jgi:hypothetical protein
LWNSFSVTGPVKVPSLPLLPPVLLLPLPLLLLLLLLLLLPLRAVEAEEDEEVLLRTRRMLLMTSGCEAL